jgi:2-polyprenyl-3-methyl-5-hydroxy-6-metoxy-1,4-benzoquinol methylase
MVFDQYASDYDVFYKTKNYQKECRYLVGLFKRYASVKPKSILDLGCGTGNYLIPLSQMGYSLTGIDASSHMLGIARKKLREGNLKARLHQAKLQSFSLKRKFDAVICMFSVIDYVTKTKDVTSTFNNVSQHLNKDGHFIFDFWQESAVERNYSPKRTRVFSHGKFKLERHSQTKIDKIKNLCTVHYECRLKKGTQLLKEYEEDHHLRFFGLDEMKSFLERAGFRILNIHPFLDIRSKVRSCTWDVTIVAQKI